MIDIFGIPSTALFGQLLLGLINGSFYALLSLGLAVIFGMLNIINFSHGAQYMMGAFAAFLLLQYLNVNYFVALVLAPVIVGFTGILVERLFLQWLYKLDHLYGLLLTFGLALIIEGVFRDLYGASGLPYRVPDALTGGQNLGFMFLPNYRAWVVGVSLVVCLATWFVIERTKLGSYLRAATENPTLVRAFGVNVPRMITLTYGFGVGLAALAGVLAAPIYNVSPQMGGDLIIVVFAVVVIGGMGSIMGAIVTGFRLGIVEGLTKVFYPEASNTLIFGITGIGLRIRPPRRPIGDHGAPQRCAQRDDRLSADAGGDRRRAVLRLSGFPDEGAVLRAVRLRLQPADRLWRPAVVRPCAVLRLGILCGRPYGQDRRHQPAVSGRLAPVGLARHSAPAVEPRARDPVRNRRGRAARAARRMARDPPARHLFRDDHAGAGPDDVLLRPAGEIHRRRGRHPGYSARAAARPRRSQRPDRDVWFRGRRCSGG